MHTNFSFGKSEGKRPHGRPKHRWENNIRLGLREIGYSVGSCVLHASHKGGDCLDQLTDY
jgi:hypothetical protein